MRYILLFGMLAMLLLAACTSAASEPPTDEQTPQQMVVYRSPTCGCCSDWVGYVEAHGYTATVEEVQNLAEVKAEYNIPPTMQSCHTAIIEGYVVEGHVPVEDIERLLTERPDVVGIAVPGMPVGSPGMEVAGVEPQPYDVVTFDAAGNTEVYSTHNQ